MDQKLQQFEPSVPYIPDLQPWRDLSAESKGQLLEGASLEQMERAEVCAFSSGILLRGVLGVRHELSDGRRVISTLYRPGALIDLRRGERAPQGLLVALAAVEFLVIDAEVLDATAKGCGDVAAMLIQQLREQGARMRDHASDLVNKTPMERLAAIIFELARFEPYCDGDRANRIVPVPVLRVDIADYIGVKPETVSRVIRRLEREGFISLPDKDQIELIDAPALRQLANGGRPRQSTQRA